MFRTVVAETPEVVRERMALVKAITDRGNIARFINVFSGVVKDVETFNLNEDGDFTAVRSTGMTNKVCAAAAEYRIEEVQRHA